MCGYVSIKKNRINYIKELMIKGLKNTIVILQVRKSPDNKVSFKTL